MVNESPIPKLIHRVWAGEDKIFKDYSENILSFNRALPDHMNVFWHGYACRLFLSQFFPYFLPYYMRLNSYAAKSDLMRYLILFKYGGIYTDWDVFVSQEDIFLKHIHTNKSCIMVTECILSEQFRESTQKLAIRRGIPEDFVRVANYFMCAVPGHAYMQAVIQEMENRLKGYKKPLRNVYDVIYLTGPDVVSTVYHQKDYGDILIGLEDSTKMIVHEQDGWSGWKKAMRFPFFRLK